MFISVWLADMVSGLVPPSSSTPLLRKFVSSLPKDMSHIPKVWSPKDISYLQGSALVSEIAVNNENDLKSYAMISGLPRVPGAGPPFSMEVWRWSQSVTNSRLFGMGGDDVGLVPVADMMNHELKSEAGKVCDWGASKLDGSFELKAGPKGSPAGEELVISYGLHSNRHMLKYYGFVQDREERIKDREMGEPEEALVGGVFVNIGAGEKILREIGKCREAEGSKWSGDVALEEAAIRAFRLKVEESRSMYPEGSDEEDRVGLGMEVGSRRQQAATVRRGEKRVLLHLERICDVAIEVLGDVKEGKLGMDKYRELLKGTCEMPKLINKVW